MLRSLGPSVFQNSTHPISTVLNLEQFVAWGKIFNWKFWSLSRVTLKILLKYWLLILTLHQEEWWGQWLIRSTFTNGVSVIFIFILKYVFGMCNSDSDRFSMTLPSSLEGHAHMKMSQVRIWLLQNLSPYCLSISSKCLFHKDILVVLWLKIAAVTRERSGYKT